MELMEVQLLCGCHCCDFNCEKGVRRIRKQTVAFLLCAWKVPIEDRPQYRRAFLENPDLVDCIIIQQRLNQIKKYGRD